MKEKKNWGWGGGLHLIQDIIYSRKKIMNYSPLMLEQATIMIIPTSELMICRMDFGLVHIFFEDGAERGHCWFITIGQTN